MRKTVPASVVLVLVLASCASVFGPQQPGQTTADKTVEDLQKSIIVIHDNLYVPIMTKLGQQLDAGKISQDKEARIQKISEQYQQAKARADQLVKMWPVSHDSTALALEISKMTAATAQLGGE